MTDLRIYVSHPIAGKTEEERVHSEQGALEFVQRVLGTFTAVLPRRIPPYCGSDEACTVPGRAVPGDDRHSWQCYMRSDLLALLNCDAILMMPGWANSAGCMAELNTATTAGIPVSFYMEDPDA
jgi:hypothetical protein